jgi:class 3 adenylate cyclase
MLDFETETMVADNQRLDEVARAVEATGWAAEVYDSNWRLAWVSKELQTLLKNPTPKEFGLGSHIFEAYNLPAWVNLVDREKSLNLLKPIIPYILYNSKQKDIEKIISKIDKHDSNHANGLKPAVTNAEPTEPPAIFLNQTSLAENPDSSADVQCLSIRILSNQGNFEGTLRVYGPGIRASVLNLITRGDENLIERMSELVSPGQQSVAILFADIDRSTKLSKQLPTALYFQLISEITQTIDEAVISHKGIVGKHVGDGTTAFFLAKDHGSSSAAARSALVAAKEISRAVEDVVVNFVKGLEDGPSQDCKTNIGIHWGDTVYMGQIVSGGRLEVTALGDQVNECARIEQAAKRGQILASKELIERLDLLDAKDLQIDNQKIIYTPVSDIDQAPKKSVDDAGNLAVVDLTKMFNEAS